MTLTPPPPPSKEDEVDDESDPPQWRNSRAREYLMGLIMAGKIPSKDAIKPKQVYDQYLKHRREFKHFQNYTELQFAGKLKYLRDKFEEKQDRRKEDAAAFAHDRTIFPARTQDTKGRPIWAGSETQRLLREDIKAGKHKKIKPKYLYESREEFYDRGFDQDFFRNKIYQEEKALKRVAWVKDKAEKKKKKEEKKKKTKK